jgi:hypothetical protein
LFLNCFNRFQCNQDLFLKRYSLHFPGLEKDAVKKLKAMKMYKNSSQGGFSNLTNMQPSQQGRCILCKPSL